MRPTQPAFSLHINWACYDAYGEAVTVDLQRLGAAHCISEYPSPLAAVLWAVKWLSGRGYTCKSDAGWYGPDCQYVNLFPILKAPAV